MSDTKPTPFVSDTQIAQYASQYVPPYGKEVRRGCNHIRDLYESHLAEVRRERDEAVDVLKRVHSILDLENPESYVNDDRSGAIDTADNIMRKFLTPNTPPSHEAR